MSTDENGVLAPSDASDHTRIVSRRQALRFTGAAGAVGLTGGLSGCLNSVLGRGGEFPSRQMEIVVPASPGGGLDYYGRLTSKYLPNHLPNDVNVVVSNVPGAAARSGANQVYNDQADGYTFLQGHLEANTTGQLLFDVDYDVREFTHLGAPNMVPRAVFGHRSVTDNYDDWDGLVEALTSGELKVATQGQGATAHTIFILIGQITGDWGPDDLSYVHYSGTAEMIPPLINGDQHLSAASYPSLPQYLGEDELELLFLMDENQSELRKQSDWGVPADAATQISNLFTTRFPHWGPPDIEEDRAQILRDALMATYEDSDLQAEAESTGRPVTPFSGADLESIINDYYDGWKEYLPVLEEATG